MWSSQGKRHIRGNSATGGTIGGHRHSKMYLLGGGDAQQTSSLAVLAHKKLEGGYVHPLVSTPMSGGGGKPGLQLPLRGHAPFLQLTWRDPALFPLSCLLVRMCTLTLYTSGVNYGSCVCIIVMLYFVARSLQDVCCDWRDHRKDTYWVHRQ